MHASKPMHVHSINSLCIAGGRSEIHRRLFLEKKEERDAALKKARALKLARLEEEAQLSDPLLRKSKLSEVYAAVAVCSVVMVGLFNGG